MELSHPRVSPGFNLSKSERAFGILLLSAAPHHNPHPEFPFREPRQCRLEHRDRASLEFLLQSCRKEFGVANLCGEVIEFALHATKAPGALTAPYHQPSQ